MKPKLILCLALVLSGVWFGFFDPQQACGYDVPFEINPTNIITDFSFLLVKSAHYGTTNDDMVIFRLVVMPKDKHQPDDFGGVLTIKEGEKYVAIVELSKSPKGGRHIYPDIPKSLMAKSVEVEFFVSSKYLSNSTVALQEGLVGPSYMFKLKEFAGGK